MPEREKRSMHSAIYITATTNNELKIANFQSHWNANKKIIINKTIVDNIFNGSFENIRSIIQSIRLATMHIVKDILKLFLYSNIRCPYQKIMYALNKYIKKVIEKKINCSIYSPLSANKNIFVLNSCCFFAAIEISILKLEYDNTSDLRLKLFM